MSYYSGTVVHFALLNKTLQTIICIKIFSQSKSFGLKNDSELYTVKDDEKENLECRIATKPQTSAESLSEQNKHL